MNAKLILLTLCSIIFFSSIIAQNPDLNLISKHEFVNFNLEKKRNVKFGISEKNNVILKFNPVSLIFSSLMFTYQKWLSPQISVDCLYSPSCSEFTRLLFKRYGFIGGFITSSDRLMRCDRISATTINHVSIDENDGKVHEIVERYVLKKKR